MPLQPAERELLRLQKMEESCHACSEEGARLFLTNELQKLRLIKNTLRVRQETTTDSLLRGTPNSAQKSGVLLTVTICPPRQRSRRRGQGVTREVWKKIKGHLSLCKEHGYLIFQRSFYGCALNFQARRQQLLCIVPCGQFGWGTKITTRVSKPQQGQERSAARNITQEILRA